MERVAPDELLRDPVNRWTATDNFLYGCVGGHFFFSLVGPTPSEAEAELAVRLYAVELGRNRKHASLFDASRLRWIDPSTFEVLRRYIHAQSDRISRALARQALVRPSGLVGAVVGGFYGLVPTKYERRLFVDRSTALGWLGCADQAASLDAVEREWLSSAPLVVELRGLLRAHERTPTLEEAARALRTSSRSLQRLLTRAGTNFRDERTAAQIERIKQLLLAGDWKLDAIALRVGCASAQVLCDLFRRETGLPPNEWKSRYRL